MELDFTILNNLKNDPPVNHIRGSEPLKSIINIDVQKDNTKATNTTLPPVDSICALNNMVSEKEKPIEQPKRYLKVERDKEDRDKARKVYVDQQGNVLKSERLRSEINKDISAAKDPYNILLKAIECISLMTGDMLFYTNNKDKLRKYESTTN